jgi:hypothetical protein
MKGYVGAALAIEPEVFGGLEERADLKITRDKDGYTVELSGEAALQASTGDAGKKGEASAEGSGGMKVSFHAATKEEAMRLARLAPQGAFEMGSVAGAGELRRHHKELSPTDKAFLVDHCSSVTFTGGMAMALAKEGGGTKSLLTGGAEGGVKGSVSESVTLNLSHGKVTGFVVEGDLTVDTSARAAAGVTKPGDADEHGKYEFKMAGKATSVGLEAGAKVHVKVSKHFELKPGATLPQGSMGSAGFYKALASQVQPGPVDASVSVEGKVEGNASFLKKEETATASVKLSGVKPTKELMTKLASGDFPGAIKLAGPGATAEVSIGSYEEEGKLEDKGSANGDGGFKLKAGFSASKRHNVTRFHDAGSPEHVLGRSWEIGKSVGSPKHAQNDTNLQDQRYAHVAG